ncbi:hypothetical protein V1505DRAFT_354362 [Lipomyces doorenjongii]
MGYTTDSRRESRFHDDRDNESGKKTFVVRPPPPLRVGVVALPILDEVLAKAKSRGPNTSSRLSSTPGTWTQGEDILVKGLGPILAIRVLEKVEADNSRFPTATVPEDWPLVSDFNKRSQISHGWLPTRVDVADIVPDGDEEAVWGEPVDTAFTDFQAFGVLPSMVDAPNVPAADLLQFAPFLFLSGEWTRNCWERVQGRVCAHVEEVWPGSGEFVRMDTHVHQSERAPHFAGITADAVNPMSEGVQNILQALVLAAGEGNSFKLAKAECIKICDGHDYEK